VKLPKAPNRRPGVEGWAEAGRQGLAASMIACWRITAGLFVEKSKKIRPPQGDGVSLERDLRVSLPALFLYVRPSVCLSPLSLSFILCVIFFCGGAPV
jgi:hypothetical protein